MASYNLAKEGHMRRVIAIFMLLVGVMYGSENLPEPLMRMLEVMEVPHDGTLASIVSATQERWIRAPGKERWHIADLSEDKKEAVINLAEEMGFFKEILPTEQEYDYVVVLGATVFRMQKRIETLIRLWNDGVRFHQVVVMTGARPLDPAVEALTEFCKTEGEAAKLLWKLAPIPEGMEKVEVVFVDVPMIPVPGGFRRPNTGDTAAAWMALKPKPGKCLFVSNQPYCLYQDAVIKSLLLKEFNVETVGDGVDGHLQNAAVVLDTVSRWLYQEQILRSASF